MLLHRLRSRSIIPVRKRPEPDNMHYAILADIHSNLAALIAVLDDIERHGGVDKVWCLGDIVGYGPDPHDCISRLRQTNHICVMGNHDGAAIGKVDISAFNPNAAAANRWTARQLTTDESDYLSHLPLVIEEGDFTLTHGSPREPIREYLLSGWSAQENLAHFSTRFCFVGHTHSPMVFACEENGRCAAHYFEPESPVVLGEMRLIINPGAVGQPRDGDPRASYAIYDSDAHMVELHRVPYDIRATQATMIAQGLPAALATRLSHGM